MPFIPDEEEDRLRTGAGFLPDPPALGPTPGFVPDEEPRSTNPVVPRAPEQPEDDQGFGLAEGAALASRTIFPTVGQVAGPVGGALGGAIGDALAQTIELATGSREKFNPALLASEAALGAIPGGKLLKGASRASRALGGAAEGALFGAGATTLTSVAERGELPSATEFGTGAALGAGLGGGIGALSTPRVKPADTPLRSVDEVGKTSPLGAPDVKPVEAPTPKPERIDTAPEPGARVLDSPRFTEMVESVNQPDRLEAIAKSPGFLEQKNLTIERLAGAISAGNLDSPEIQKLATELGGMQELAEVARGTAAESARVLQSLSALQQNVTKLEDAGRITPEQANALRFVFGGKEKPPPGFRQRFVIPLLNFRRAMLTGQISTGVRNAIVGVPRNFFEAVDQTLSGYLKGEGLSGLEFAKEAFRSPGERSKEIGAVAGLNKVTAREIERLLFTPTVAEFPIERLKGAAQKVANVVTWANQRQEVAFRRFAFNGTLKARLAAKGVDFATAIADPARWIDVEDVRHAVDRALEVTFATEVPRGALGRVYLGVFKTAPELTLINPFPRFQVNATRFIYDHSPAAVLSLLGKNAEGNLLLSDPKAVADTLAKMAVGTSMLAAGMAFRYSELAGERWYEVKAGDGKVIDLRPFNPLASFAFFAEGLKRMDEERSLDALKQDFGEAALSLNRAGALGFTAGDLITGRTGTLSQENLERALGEILGSFTRPLGQIRDFLSVAIPGEAETPDVRSAPFLGEALRNVPFAGKVLPPARPSLTTGEPRRQPMAVLRQLAGLTVKDRDAVEKALLESDIEPFTLTPRRRVRTREGTEEQREVEQQLATLFSTELPKLIETERFQDATREERRVMLTQRTGALARRAQALARAALREQRPGLVETVTAQELESSPPRSFKDIREKERLERLGFGAR